MAFTKDTCFNSMRGFYRQAEELTVWRNENGYYLGYSAFQHYWDYIWKIYEYQLNRRHK